MPVSVSVPAPFLVTVPDPLMAFAKGLIVTAIEDQRAVVGDRRVADRSCDPARADGKRCAGADGDSGRGGEAAVENQRPPLTAVVPAPVSLPLMINVPALTMFAPVTDWLPLMNNNPPLTVVGPE